MASLILSLLVVPGTAQADTYAALAKYQTVQGGASVTTDQVRTDKAPAQVTLIPGQKITV
ncbi:MAG: hypothetical protein JO362_14580 [Streptomycetaceae bacterium]|nr:hypothetical protein [Streptomycetaceae bacterium]